MDITLEQLERINKHYPELIAQLNSNVEQMDHETDEEYAERITDPQDTLDEINTVHYGNSHELDDEVDYEDDFDDEDDEDYYEDDFADEEYEEYEHVEQRYPAVVSTTSTRVSIFVNELAYGFSVTEIPSQISTIVRRLIKPTSDEDLLLSESDIVLLRSAQVPRLAKLIAQVSGGAIIIEKDGITLDGDAIGNNNIDTLLDLARDNNISGIKQFIRFQRSLQNNTSSRIINRLYDFVKCTSIGMDENGDIIAYKAINANLYDCFTGNTFLNSEGAVIEMARNQVDDDDHRTCSTGLHVCSLSYLKGFFWSTDKRLAIVKIKPEDFVSIPVDYNDAKARVCKYTVSKVCTIEEAEEILGRKFHSPVDDYDNDDDFDDEYEDFSDFI